MSDKSRTKNAVINSSVALGTQLIGIILNFICRTIFTLALGAEYLGVSGLFTNILTILNFAELGVGTAIVYRLYKPLAEKNEEQIIMYINLYKKVYRVIVAIILIAGISLIPFLKYIVDAPAVLEDIRLLYCLYLAQTVASYIFVYKKSLLIADQKNYIASIIDQFVNIIINILQCIVLLVFHNFIFYCILVILYNLSSNIICSVYVNRHYSFINNKVEKKLSNGETKKLKSDIKGLLLTNIAATTFNGTDNIFISAYIGVRYVGVLSNYTLILTTINGMMNKVFNSITASMGNLVVKGDLEQAEIVLKRLYFLNATLYGYICTGMLLLIRTFVMDIWLNDSFYLSDFIIALSIIELLLRSLHYPIHTTQNAMGLFSQYRILYFIAAIINIILDFLLVKPLGIAGLYIATLFCRSIIFITDIFVVYKIGFKKSSISYYIMFGKWMGFMAISVMISSFIIKFISGPIIFEFILKGLVITAVYFVLHFICYRNSSEYLYFKNLLKTNILRRKK